MTSRITALAFDTRDHARLADFWCAVLGWRVLETGDDGTAIAPPDRDWPTLDFMDVPEGKVGKNRLHVDLRADGTSTAAELQRLLDLGATRTDVGQGEDVSWIVLADPEGNELCLLSRTVQEVDDGP